MLDDFEKQKNVCDIMFNEIKNGHVSHAYLIDENNNSKSFDMVISFVKEILCLNKSNEEREILCKRIDDGNYPELKIIEPDGLLIKKQQILDLQKEFSLSSVEGNKRVYIIRNCEKMRPETANSMLKFLEEPESDITAILMTNNINNILSTIISRCQIIRIGNDVVVNEFNELDEIVLNFIDSIETIGKRSIMNTNELIFNKISSKDRDGLIKFLDKVIDMYYDILKIIIDDNNKSIYYDKLVKYANINDKNKVLNKIDFLVYAKDSIKYNVNCNLLIDSLILSIGG